MWGGLGLLEPRLLLAAAPVAVDDFAVTAPDSAIVVNVLANDTDVDGDIDPLTLVITSGPQSGNLVVADPATGLLSYTPLAGFIGPDEFRYTVADSGALVSNEAVAKLQVGILSDDFSSPTLNTDLWTFVDPAGDSTLTMTV